MRALIATEWLKLRTTRALYVAAGFVALLSVGLPIVGAALAGSGDVLPLEPGDLAQAVRAPVALTGGAVLLLGLLASAGEFRHRTVLTTRLAEPRPARVLAAKLVTMGALGAVTGALVTTTTLAVAAVVFPQEGVAFEPDHHGVLQVAALVPLVTALHGVLGVALGSLVRNTAAAVGATLLWAFVIEGVVPVVTKSPGLVDWLPTGLIREALATQPAPGQVAPIAAVALLLAYAGALTGLAAVLEPRREL